MEAMPGHSLPLLRWRYCGADRGGGHLAVPAAGGGLPDPDRAARGHRDAHRRGDPPRPRRPRPRRRRADRASVQVRQVPAAAAAPGYGRCAARLPAAPRPPAPASQHRGGVHLPGRRPAGLPQRARHMEGAGRPRRAAGPLAVVPPPHPRPEALVRGRQPAGCLRRRAGRPGPARTAGHLPRPRGSRCHLLVPIRRAGTAGPGQAAARTPPAGAAMTALAPTLQAFFTDRLARQRQASPHTIAAYRDTWRLLLSYAARHTGRQPSQLDLADLGAPLIGDFLDHLEHHRGNTARTRNARLAAIHSLFRYAALRCPEHAELIARVLAIPPKRYDKALVTWLTEPELAALLGAPDRTTWAGRRDHALILLAAQTGLRIAELTGLTLRDVHLGTGAHVCCTGKGRKQRITPLTTNTVAVLRTWIAERRGQPQQPLFPTRTGKPLSRDAIEHRLAKHTATAAANCPSLAAKASRRTRCVTQRRCDCCTPGPTPQSSRFGSGMSKPKPRKSTCMPISPLKNERSPEPSPQIRNPGATGHPTSS